MIMPILEGYLKYRDFFIYTACDSAYFNEFGTYLINSIIKNSTNNIHVHIFNPKKSDIAFCNEKNISYSYEQAPLELFVESTNKWDNVDTDNTNYQRILTAMQKGGDNSVIERIQKTYYACARFVRLRQLMTTPIKYFSIDVDAVVRSSIPEINSSKDFLIHKISNPRPRFLAGGLYSLGSQNSLNFLNEYSVELTNNIVNNDLYWELDQDILYNIVPKYNFESLPKNLIDWDMKLDSIVWTAKGTRKNNDVFVSEKIKYAPC